MLWLFSGSPGFTCWISFSPVFSKREHVESNALNSWKLNVIKIIDGRISFYCNNLDFLPPKPKFTFRH